MKALYFEACNYNYEHESKTKSACDWEKVTLKRIREFFYLLAHTLPQPSYMYYK